MKSSGHPYKANVTVSGQRSDIQTSPVVNSVVVRNPIDRNAFNVVQPGDAPWPTRSGGEWRGAAPPLLRDRRPNDQQDMTGRTFGKLTVIGLSTKAGKDSRGGAACWICRCECGYFVARKTKAVRNSRNNYDACTQCRHVEALKEAPYRRRVFNETGQWPSREREWVNS